MDDIVKQRYNLLERLRIYGNTPSEPELSELINEAADEIEKLLRDNTKAFKDGKYVAIHQMRETLNYLLDKVEENVAPKSN